MTNIPDSEESKGYGKTAFFLLLFTFYCWQMISGGFESRVTGCKRAIENIAPDIYAEEIIQIKCESIAKY